METDLSRITISVIVLDFELVMADQFHYMGLKLQSRTGSAN